MYNLIFIDTDIDRTTVHKMNVITGDYLKPVHIKGNFINRATELVSIVIKDKPDKIIFDKMGYGMGMFETFMQMAKSHRFFQVDSFGLITYSE